MDHDLGELLPPFHAISQPFACCTVRVLHATPGRTLLAGFDCRLRPTFSVPPGFAEPTASLSSQATLPLPLRRSVLMPASKQRPARSCSEARRLRTRSSCQSRRRRSAGWLRSSIGMESSSSHKPCSTWRRASSGGPQADRDLVRSPMGPRAARQARSTPHRRTTCCARLTRPYLLAGCLGRDGRHAGGSGGSLRSWRLHYPGCDLLAQRGPGFASVFLQDMLPLRG